MPDMMEYYYERGIARRPGCRPLSACFLWLQSPVARMAANVVSGVRQHEHGLRVLQELLHRNLLTTLMQLGWRNPQVRSVRATRYGLVRENERQAALQAKAGSQGHAATLNDWRHLQRRKKRMSEGLVVISDHGTACGSLERMIYQS